MRVLALVLLLSACAVKGYDLGWRDDGRLTPLLGAPGDALSGCTLAEGAAPPSPVCAALGRDLRVLLAELPPAPEAPAALGFRCRGARCSYANVWERRDVGTAAVIPVFRRVGLREVRIAAARAADGRWQLETLVVRDAPPPTYGPVTIGGQRRPR